MNILCLQRKLFVSFYRSYGLCTHAEHYCLRGPEKKNEKRHERKKERKNILTGGE
jgi:hypothetical protein